MPGMLTLVLTLHALVTSEPGPPCADLAASPWRPPTAPSAILPAAFRRGRTRVDPGVCAVAICHARVTGSSGGFLERDIPDVAIRLTWAGETFTGRGEDDARQAWVAVSLRPIDPGLRWAVEVRDDDGFGADDVLARREGVLDAETLAWSHDAVSFECRFLGGDDLGALARALGKAIDTDAAALARRPGSSQRAVFERLLERLDALTSLTGPRADAATQARAVVRAALVKWVPAGGRAAVDRTGATLSLGPGLSVAVTVAPDAKAAIVLSHMLEPYGFEAFGTWVDLASPELAHGSASPALVGTLEVAPGARALVEFRALGAGAAPIGEPLLVGAWQKGFFGAARPFALRR